MRFSFVEAGNLVDRFYLRSFWRLAMKSVCDPVPAWQQIQNKMRVGFGWLATRATDGIAMLLLLLLFSSSTLHAQGLIYDESDQWQE